ncbi:sigma 54-interacting transcriptional regulator [Desulfovibrio aminophilus]|uniref:sigma-54-dependent transcriptional regulator n=1 Tax=Desulfovibrio aminophilus TaxID=81425 RepID=UPI00339794EF
MQQTIENDVILVVDDEVDFANGVARLITKGFPNNPVLVLHDGPSALAALRENRCGLLLTDLRMPGMDGAALLDQALARNPLLSVILLTGFGTIETAVAALKAGAYDFLTKPIDQDGLYRAVTKGLERSALLAENRRLRAAVVTCGSCARFIGESPAIRDLRTRIEAVAATDYTVLILGESGVGKELVARTIHALSHRGSQRLVSLNCTAIPDQILESELFGHVKGAFTGADQPRRGLFQTADGGSLLLDEIGDLPPHLQPKLLRALEEGAVRPVGGSENIKVDVRILASTNQNLESRVASGAFREDLFYRLNVLTVRVPSLRERPNDIPILVRHYLRETCGELDAGGKELADDALDYLSCRPWPGNVRELLNFVRRLVVFCPGPMITQAQVRLLDTPGGGPTPAISRLEIYKDAKHRLVDDFTRSYMQRLLEETGGNVSQAARLSGLERVSLQKILRRLGMAAEGFRNRED